MASQEEPLIHGYKISDLKRWNIMAAYILVAGVLDALPQRWHIEKDPRVRTDLFGYTWQRHYYRLHYRHNGEWKRRYLKIKDAVKLLNLGITNAHLTQRSPQ